MYNIYIYILYRLIIVSTGGSPIMNIARTMDVRLGGAFLINSEGDTFINMYIYICI
jgi:hypothetical protein